MANNLKDHLKEVADAIRAKKGTSDLINPQDFATEIEGISGGGSGEGGGSNIQYLDVSGLSDNEKMSCLLAALQVKLTGENVSCGVQILTPGLYLIAANMLSVVTAISIDMALPITKYSSGESDKQELTTIEGSGISELIGNIPRLTKEQFYDLNA